jgi:chromosome segregation ATPase
MAYTPTEPTGPPPGFLVAMDENGLVNALKAHADFLLTRHRLHIMPELEGANHQIKHIINILMDRYRRVNAARIFAVNNAQQAENRERELRIHLGSSKDLLRYTQRGLDAVTRERDELRYRRGALERRVDALTRERDIARAQHNAVRVQRDGINAQYNLVYGQLANANNQVANVNNQLRIEQFIIRNLGRARATLIQRNAALRIQVQWFRNRQLNPPPIVQQNPQTWLILH